MLYEVVFIKFSERIKKLEYYGVNYKYLYFRLFQHYRLFLFMFTHSQAEEIIGTDVSMQVFKHIITYSIVYLS